MIEASLLQPVRWGWQTFRTDASSGTYIYWLTSWWWVLSILSLDSLDNLVVHKFFFVRFFFYYDFICPPQIMRSIIIWRKTHSIILYCHLLCEMLINLVKHNTMYHKWNKAVRVPLDTIHKQGIVWQMYSTRYLTELTRPNCRKE